MKGPEPRRSSKSRSGGAYGSPEDGPRSRGRKKSRDKGFGSNSIADVMAQRSEGDRKLEKSLTTALDRVAAGGSRPEEGQVASSDMAKAAHNLQAAKAMSAAALSGQFTLSPEEAKQAFLRSFV
ncbi:unnamed protein product [Pylaiella littoralis]